MPNRRPLPSCPCAALNLVASFYVEAEIAGGLNVRAPAMSHSALNTLRSALRRAVTHVLRPSPISLSSRLFSSPVNYSASSLGGRPTAVESPDNI